MNTFEIIVLVECIVALTLFVVIIVMAVTTKRRKDTNVVVEVTAPRQDRLYDPYGLYAPVSEEELRLIDEQARAYVEKQHHGRNSAR